MIFLAERWKRYFSPQQSRVYRAGLLLFAWPGEGCDEHNLKSISGNSYCISILFAEMGCWKKSGGREIYVDSLNEALHGHAQREVK